MKKYNDLSHKELLDLIEKYNTYIQEFDYANSGTPVSIYEFYEFEYQEIINIEE